MAFAIALTLCTLYAGDVRDNCQTYDIAVYDTKKECDDDMTGEADLFGSAWAATDLPEAVSTYLRHWNIKGVDVKHLNNYDFTCEHRSEDELP